MADNRCVCCGEIIPEGMIACPNCLVVSKKKTEMKPCPIAFECKHCLVVQWNELGEKLALCEIWGEWKNITLGDCVGNCESEEKE